MKIRGHLALIATAALIPVIFFSAAALDMLLEAERKAALKSLHETARSTALMVDRELGSAKSSLAALATSDTLANGDFANFYRRAKAVNNSNESWVVLFDRNGKELVNTSKPFGISQSTSAALTFDNIQKVIDSGKLAVSGLINDPIVNGSYTTLAVPTSTPNGQQYVLAQVFITSHFSRIFAENNISPKWTVGIFDQQGNFISRNRKSQTMTGRPARPELITASKQFRDGQIRHKTWEEVDSYDVFTHSSLSDWTVAVAVPTESVESAARSAVLVAALGLLAAVAAAAGTAALVSRRLLRSISAVYGAASSLAKGQASTPTHTGIEEMDQFAGALTGVSAVLIK
jgi:hypothetical protein